MNGALFPGVQGVRSQQRPVDTAGRALSPAAASRRSRRSAVAESGQQAAEELRLTQDRLARALGASRLALWEYDGSSGRLELLEGWTQLLGLPPTSAHVHPEELARFIPAHERDRVNTALRQLLKGETERMALEHQAMAPDGRPIWLRSAAEVSGRSADGRALRVVGTCQNITQSVRADAALRAALRAADQANQAKSDFLATMSHEIRTPLNGVIGLTELLAGADLPPMEADSVAMIDSCAKSLLSVVDNILDFSRIEAGRLTLEAIPTDVHRMMRDIGDVFGVRGAEKGVRFTLAVDPAAPQWVQADPTRLRQILINLLGNALKFTPSGRFSLSLGLAGTAAAPQLAFAVGDSGIGIAPEDQALLFQRFSQVDASTTRRFSGSGLGLSISRQLAQLMGGDITLQSVPGVGSTFTLLLPLRLAEAAGGTEPAQLCNEVDQDAAILLAEDNVVNQLVAQRLLGRLGYRNVTVVANGREAVEACETRRYALVLMDCQMPEMNGWEAARRLRADGHAMPIVALTASAVAGDRERCLMAGMDDYLTKPIETALLAEKVHRSLAEARARQPVAAESGAVPAGVDVELEPEAPPPAFEPGVIDERFFGEVALFEECRRLFLRQTGDLLTAIGSRLAAGDAPAARALAHKVRGSAATVGAARLADRCGRIEHAAAFAGYDARAAEWLDEGVVALEQFVAESLLPA